MKVKILLKGGGHTIIHILSPMTTSYEDDWAAS